VKEEQIFDQIAWAFLILAIGTGFGYAWAYVVFN